MILSGTRLIVGLLIVVGVCVGIASLPGGKWLAVAAGIVGTAIALLASAYRTPLRRRLHESEEVADLTPQRRAELIRGTSKFLHEMGYRYSVRPDPNPTGERRCFSAEINALRLGFIPAVITDNDDDRQGYGYVAFVFDHHRWRGPGLPCPPGQAAAVQHAAQCVSPLENAD